MNKEQIQELVSHISFEVLNTKFKYLVKEDSLGGRVYIQLAFASPDAITGDMTEWTSRKYYLSEHMIEDEIVKTCFMAAKQCVEHEVMEGFQFDSKVVFNPHVNFRALLSITDQMVLRKNVAQGI